ncbi:sugar transferase [Roseobacter sinensis]|uniref:Sugar transferase n=1 Tax=Roseobacter sinensis TaxID=2931391 RepID=A0ABT3BKS6_9RHOB|nr:sugar transferase [Roseobacter sp. WL0113]MCV3273954.1 sugar transferase [Roseobacter sp. WL0113]
MSHHGADLDFARPTALFGAPEYTGRAKRGLDIVLVLMSAPVTVPLVSLLWILIRLDGSPGFFGHRRIGRAGRTFTCWKLRTMVPDAEHVLQHHLHEDAQLAQEWAETFKLQNDPRVTRLGALLRKTSLDELPQLWNVLRGDMSLVGPRPVPRDELANYADRAWAYKMMRPGLTGLWQVTGRGSCTYDERVEMDVDYARRVSAGLDLKIIFKTFGVVLRKTGS